jgi:5-methylthioadenosine/S-adenosylhomocysteine deaminase
MTDPLVLTGRLVTFDDANPVIDAGTLYIGSDEKIAAAQPAAASPPPGFEGVEPIKTGGTIYPGLIDLHGHMVYNALSLWSPAGRHMPYTTRYQWPDADDYKDRIGNPANALGALAGKAMLRYVEVKAVIGGTTAVQGSTKMAKPYEGWLVRNVEDETFKTGKKLVYQSALQLHNDKYKATAKLMKEGKAFLYHLCEGTDHQKLLKEFEKMRDRNCLQPTLGAIHCTSLAQSDYGEWAPHGGSVIWSPFSNLWLYANTTQVDLAKQAGVRVCLGADWSPSGSKNLLGELKVADMWNREELGKTFSDEEICAMATANPADALGWGDRVGRLKAGLHGDVLVIKDSHKDPDPYRTLIKAVEKDVLFVAINGQPFYGTTKLMQAAGAQHAEPISLGRLRRSVQLIYDDVPEADMGWKALLADIAAATKDPLGRYYELEKQHGNPDPEKKPLWLMTDKPWDNPKVTGRPVKILPQVVRIPPLDSLVHDKKYFDAVEASPLHGGLLDGLRDYYV